MSVVHDTGTMGTTRSSARCALCAQRAFRSHLKTELSCWPHAANTGTHRQMQWIRHAARSEKAMNQADKSAGRAHVCDFATESVNVIRCFSRRPCRLPGTLLAVLDHDGCAHWQSSLVEGTREGSLDLGLDGLHRIGAPASGRLELGDILDRVKVLPAFEAF